MKSMVNKMLCYTPEWDYNWKMGYVTRPVLIPHHPDHAAAYLVTNKCPPDIREKLREQNKRYSIYHDGNPLYIFQEDLERDNEEIIPVFDTD